MIRLSKLCRFIIYISCTSLLHCMSEQKNQLSKKSNDLMPNTLPLKNVDTEKKSQKKVPDNSSQKKVMGDTKKGQTELPKIKIDNIKKFQKNYELQKTKNSNKNVLPNVSIKSSMGEKRKAPTGLLALVHYHNFLKQQGLLFPNGDVPKHKKKQKIPNNQQITNQEENKKNCTENDFDINDFFI